MYKVDGIDLMLVASTTIVEDTTHLVSTRSHRPSMVIQILLGVRGFGAKSRSIFQARHAGPCLNNEQSCIPEKAYEQDSITICILHSAFCVVHACTLRRSSAVMYSSQNTAVYSSP